MKWERGDVTGYSTEVQLPSDLPELELNEVDRFDCSQVKQLPLVLVQQQMFKRGRSYKIHPPVHSENTENSPTFEHQEPKCPRFIALEAG